MKFYYNDQLIRTSKNHQYTHALIDQKTNNCIGCRTSYEACVALLNSSLNSVYESIENAHRKLEAIENGRPTYFIKDGRKEYRVPTANSETALSSTKEWIDMENRRLNEIKNQWTIVELEAR